jgi:hypothetical protein
MYFFVKALETRDMKHYLAMAIANALMLYAHFFGAFVILAQLASVPLAQNGTIEWRRLIGAYVLTGLLAAPLAGSLLLSSGVNPWAWADPVTLRAVLSAVNALTGGGLPIAMVIYFLCGLASLIYAVGRIRQPHGEEFSWRYGLTLLWFGGPIGTLLLISIAMPAFHDRYLITTLPPLSILAAIGLLAIPNRWLRSGAIAGLVVISLVNVVQQYGTQSKRDWRAASEFVLANSLPGDAVLFYSWMAKYPFEYYYRRSVDPESIDDRLVCVWPSPFLVPSSEANVVAHVRLVKEYAEPDAHWFASLSGAHPRLWVVLAMDDIEGMGMDSGPVVEQIGRHYGQREEFVLDRVRILRFEATGRGQAGG